MERKYTITVSQEEIEIIKEAFGRKMDDEARMYNYYQEMANPYKEKWERVKGGLDSIIEQLKDQDDEQSKENAESDPDNVECVASEEHKEKEEVDVNDDATGVDVASKEPEECHSKYPAKKKTINKKQIERKKENIKFVRENMNGMSIHAMAVHCGVSDASIYNYIAEIGEKEGEK